jgi:hypothetical protein
MGALKVMAITSENVKGGVVAFVIAGIGFGGYTVFQNRQEANSNKPMSVETAFEEVSPDRINAARDTPEQVYMTAKDENLPLFLAFLDHDLEIIDETVAEYQRVFDRIDKYYASNTPKQIVQGIFDIEGASAEIGFMTYMEAMQYLLTTVPNSFDVETATSFATKDCLQVAEDVHKRIVVEYYRPMIEAEEAEQAQQQAQANYEWKLHQQALTQIDRNVADMRQRGSAKNAARDARAAERERRYMQQVNFQQNQLQNQIRQDSNRRNNWNRWNRYPN